jgi:hypothetical protein
MDEVLAAMVALVLIVGAWERRQLVQALKDSDEGFLSHVAEMERQHQAERRELANRIQHPAHVPVLARTRTREKPSEAPTQRVGTVAVPKAEE